MTKITLDDIKKNKTNNILIPFYTVILAVVYSWWMVALQDSKSPWGTIALVASFVLPTAICICGTICLYLSNLKVANARIANNEEKGTNE